MITVERFAYTPFGTFGRLTFSDFECFTVERPWENNEPDVSCIPVGTYPLDPNAHYHRGNYDCCEILEVEGRTLIKIHIANTLDDVKGCIGVGSKLGWVHWKWAVENSRNTFFQLMSRVIDLQPDKIEIRNIQAGVTD
jgi:hypothetical protein